MTGEVVGTGWKLTHEVVGPTAAASTVSAVLTPLDGKEVPVLVNGRPSGQTMRIWKIDSRHTGAVMMFQGEERSVSKSEISPDGKVLTVETEYATSNPIGLPESKSSTGKSNNDNLVALRQRTPDRDL